ncbi:MAG: diguanylate cyclase [Rhodospirillaceae bacterium]|nr:MAG: diguanylate cyclase [Rhodospirillaceae bacterium]
MIHNFKNAVLRQDELHITVLEQNIVDVRRSIESIRATGVNRTEESALQDIAAVIETYAEHLTIARAMMARGENAHAIDAAVKVDDTPALRGFAVINAEITAAVGAGNRIVAAAMNRMLVMSGMAVGIVIVLFTLASVNLWWINRRLIRPMMAIVAAIQLLAEGNMADALPSRNQSDEIGAMADALGVFRDNAIEKARLHDLATTDTLTGIRNRLKFIQTLEAEILRHQRYGSPLSLVMMDIDHFKRINDTFGHAAGDATLKQVTAIVVQRIRVTDTFARWGGEEFILLLPGEDARAAGRVAETLRMAIADQDFSVAGRVTASFGVAEFRAGDDEAGLCQRADEALYQAKRQGRNQVQGTDGAPASSLDRSA